MATAAELIEELKSISVLELSELVKALEEEFGVSATAVAAAAPAAAAAVTAPRPRRSRGRSTSSCRRGREEDPGDQGRSGGHRPWPQGGEGAGDEAPKPVRRAWTATRARAQGRARGGRRQRRAEVARRAADPAAHESSSSQSCCKGPPSAAPLR